MGNLKCKISSFLDGTITIFFSSKAAVRRVTRTPSCCEIDPGYLLPPHYIYYIIKQTLKGFPHCYIIAGCNVKFNN